MEPQDDPEARIRELERPLTDQARTSELGAARPGYAYPPAQPPITYGAPFPPPQKTTAGFGGRWIVLAVFIIGAITIGAGIAAYGVRKFSEGGFIMGPPNSRPSISSGRSSIPGSRPGAPSSVTAPPGGELSVAGAGANKTIACNDSSVSVSGFSNTVVITGHCARLTVSGAQNIVTVDAVDTINASGFSNQVTFHSGSPNVEKSGESNIVEQG